MTSSKTPANNPKATFTGSGTAVMSRLQLPSVLGVKSPPDRSAKKIVQFPFGLPVKFPNVPPSGRYDWPGDGVEAP